MKKVQKFFEDRKRAGQMHSTYNEVPHKRKPGTVVNRRNSNLIKNNFSPIRIDRQQSVKSLQPAKLPFEASNYQIMKLEQNLS